MDNQENIRFQSHVVYTLDLHNEFKKGFTQTSALPITMELVTIAVSILFFLYYYILMNSPVSFAYGFLFLTAIFLVAMLITALRNRKGDLNYKRMLSANNWQTPDNTYSFSDDGIHILADNGNTAHLAYEQIQYIFETENLFVLMLKYRQGVSIDKRTLSGGHELHFVEYLMEHCPGIRRKKVRDGTLGQIVHFVKLAVLVCGVVLSIMNLPIVQRLAAPSGSVNRYMSYQEIADRLEDLGITGATPEMLEEMEEYYDAYSSHYGPYFDKVTDYLCWIGMGQYDQETWEWTPATGGVYWFDTEVFAVDTMYTDFLRGVSAISAGELDFTDIQEDISGVDWDRETGTQAISFSWKGQRYRLEGAFNGDWFDLKVADSLNNIIRSQGGEKQLYFAYDQGQGCLVFYCNAQWAKEFENKTGINLVAETDKINMGFNRWF